MWMRSEDNSQQLSSHLALKIEQIHRLLQTGSLTILYGNIFMTRTKLENIKRTLFIWLPFRIGNLFVLFLSLARGFAVIFKTHLTHSSLHLLFRIIPLIAVAFRHGAVPWEGHISLGFLFCV